MPWPPPLVSYLESSCCPGPLWLFVPALAAGLLWATVYLWEFTCCWLRPESYILEFKGTAPAFWGCMLALSDIAPEVGISYGFLRFLLADCYLLIETFWLAVCMLEAVLLAFIDEFWFLALFDNCLWLWNKILGGKPFIIHSCWSPSSGESLFLGSHSRQLAMKFTKLGSGVSLSLFIM